MESGGGRIRGKRRGGMGVVDEEKQSLPCRRQEMESIAEDNRKQNQRRSIRRMGMTVREREREE